MVTAAVPGSTPPNSDTTPDSTLSPAQQKLMAVGVRLGLVTLLAFFYFDGFLRGATPLEMVVFGLFALPLLAGLLHTVWELPGLRMPSWADVIASALGASAVAFIARGWHVEPVLAAAVVGVLGALPILPASIRSLAAPIYVGAFAGMTSPLVLAHPGWIALAGATAGLLYSLLRSTWIGVGGKLGFLAFSGVSFAALIADRIGESPGGAKLLQLQTADRLAVLVTAPLAALATYEVQRHLRWSPVLASASVTCAFVLAMVLVGAESLFVVAPSAIACFGGSFIAMTGEIHAASRPWLPAAGGLLYALLQIAFEPTLAGMGGDFGATAVVAVLVVIGIEKLVEPLFGAKRRKRT